MTATPTSCSIADTKSLAQHCFDSDSAPMELFDRVIDIVLGYPWTMESPMPVEDSWTDGYDGSVELIMNRPYRLTRETADQILALGFDQIYESFWSEEGESKCLSWSARGESERRPKGAHEESTSKFKKLQAQLAQLRTALIAANEALGAVYAQNDDGINIRPGEPVEDECPEAWIRERWIIVREAIKNNQPETTP